MRITAPKRGRRGAKRLDLTDMRDLFRDHRMWFALGIVERPDDGDDTAIIGATDVQIEVVLQPSLQPVTCRLPAGVWDVPDEGDEVMVGLPEGAIDFMPVIVGRLSSGHVAAVQGPQAGRIVLERDEVLVHDGNGGAVSLALKTDVINVDNKYAGHLHLAPNGPTGGPLATTVPNPPNPNFPVPDAVNPFLTVPGGIPTTNPASPGAGLTAAVITGTSCLKAK